MKVDALQNEALRIEVDLDNLQVSVTDLDSGAKWRFQSDGKAELRIRHGMTDTSSLLQDAREKTVRRFSTPSEERLTVFLRGLPGDVGLAVTLALPPGGAMLRVEVEPLPTTSTAKITDLWYPGTLVSEHDETEYTIWPHGAGMMIPARHDQEITAGTTVNRGLEQFSLPYALGFTRSLYEPWWGVVGRESGYAAIAETPFDFGLELNHPRGGPTFTRPVWLSSLGHLAYPRAIRYYFTGKTDHVQLAKTYRRYAQEIGRWMSLEEKLKRNPMARQLIGSTIFPISICRHNMRTEPVDHQVATFSERANQVKRLLQLGREKAYLHIDGWGTRGYDNQHPDIFPPCPEAGGWEGLIALSKTAKECGYLFGLHDQYRDYYLDGPAYLEHRAIKMEDGGLPQWSRWAGGPQTVLCAREALSFVRHNFTELLARGVELSASYLDVFAIVPLDECFDPHHPMTREDCFRFRAKALDYVRSLGLAISSEEPVDCFTQHLDFAHWADYPREQFMVGEYLGIPVPVHSLVYHDALLLPAVFDYGRVGDLRARHFLEGLSQVEIPYGKITWDRAERFRDVDILAKLHAAWGTHELVNHRLLDADGMVQEFEYPEGKVSVDLKELRYRIEGGPVMTDGWQAVNMGETETTNA